MLVIGLAAVFICIFIKMSIGKYFIAIVLPEPFQAEIMGLKQYVSENFNSKGALRSPAHITLHMPFEWKEEKENILIEKLQGFTFDESISVRLKNFSAFEPRVVFVDVVPDPLLGELYKSLVTHIKQNLNLFNEANNARGFHPHATIAFRDLKKPMFYKAWEHFKNREYSGSFTTRTFHLLKHSPGKWEVYREFTFKND